MPLFSSGGIDRIAYDPESRVLEIWFQGSTGPYRFLDVPPDVADGLREAGSAMAYFDEHIRDRYGVR